MPCEVVINSGTRTFGQTIYLSRSTYYLNLQSNDYVYLLIFVLVCLSCLLIYAGQWISVLVVVVQINTFTLEAHPLLGLRGKIEIKSTDDCIVQ